MKKVIIIASVILIIVLLLAGGGIWWYKQQLDEQVAQNAELQELAELDKKEMEDQYRQFDIQYGELQKSLKNDSLFAQIEVERRRTQQLLEELEHTKATDAKEIARLKKEIASLRAVLQSYIIQVDSLNSLNKTLVAENTVIRHQVEEANVRINDLSTERNTLKDKVDLAAQLDATGLWITPKNKKSKDTHKVKEVRKFAFGFTIVKNITASNGERTLYARIVKPDGNVLGKQGTFPYENTTLEYTEKKYIEYTGEEMKITMYSDLEEFLEAGTYHLFIFADKQMIAQTTFTLE